MNLELRKATGFPKAILLTDAEPKDWISSQVLVPPPWEARNIVLQSENIHLTLFFFFFLPFLGPLPRHVEVPRLGV